MATPLTYIEDQLALREELVKSVELMENHLAEPHRTPSVGFHAGGESITAESLARVKEQIAEIDERIERLRVGNA